MAGKLLWKRDAFHFSRKQDIRRKVEETSVSGYGIGSKKTVTLAPKTNPEEETPTVDGREKSTKLVGKL